MTQQQPIQDAVPARSVKSSPLLFQAGVFVIIVAATLILFNSWQIWNAHQRDLRSAEHESANLARSRSMPTILSCRWTATCSI